MAGEDTTQRSLTRSSHRKDEDEQKRYPNSINAIIVAVAKSYLNRVNPEKHLDDAMSYEQFIQESKFEDVYEATLEKFKGVKLPPRKNLAEMLERMGRGSSTDMPYYRLRAIADFLKIPVGALLLYAQFVSLERRIDDREERKEGLQQFVDALRRITEAAERQIASLETKEGAGVRDSDDYLFSHYHNYDDALQEIWVADIDALIEWCEAFADGDLEIVNTAARRR